MASLVLLFTGCVFLFLLLKAFRYGNREKHLLPGPPTYPIIGNIPSLPLHHQFTQWAKQYGDIYSVKIGSMTMVILSSIEAIRQVIERDTTLTADRPPNHFANVTVSGNGEHQPFVIFTRYSNMWKNQRRAMHEMLRAQACLNYVPIHKAETYQLAVELLKDPEGFANHTRRLMFSTMMSIVYGIRVPSSSSNDWIKFYKFYESWSGLMAPGAHMPVDAFPFLKYVPEMFAPWKRITKELNREEKALFYGLLERVEERLARGEGNGCFAEILLEKGKAWGVDREVAK
ncbi:cytochrome P450 [Cyathus striatus]|nr:cytochrome P450 [Cyathus striatus]